MSDFHATEKLIGGSIVVGTASLLNWNASQSGDPGLVGTALILAMVLGGLWVVAGLLELFMGRERSNARVGASRARAGTPPV